MIIAIYPGNFDPITNGHLDIAVRASKLFDKLTISVYDSPVDRKLLFTTEERVNLAREAVKNIANVEVVSYTGLTGTFARQINCRVMVRGLRMSGDFEYEFNFSAMSKKLFPELEFICLMASTEYQFLSSTMLKEAASLGGKIGSLVPPNVVTALINKFSPKVGNINQKVKKSRHTVGHRMIS
jgi:pantetheine-phosphate adenylyltransferase